MVQSPPSHHGSEADDLAVADMRVRLLAGLKRYLHGKRLNGLLSSEVSTTLWCYVPALLQAICCLSICCHSCAFEWLQSLDVKSFSVSCHLYYWSQHAMR